MKRQYGFYIQFTDHAPIIQTRIALWEKFDFIVDHLYFMRMAGPPDFIEKPTEHGYTMHGIKWSMECLPTFAAHQEEAAYYVEIFMMFKFVLPEIKLSDIFRRE